MNLIQFRSENHRDNYSDIIYALKRSLSTMNTEYQRSNKKIQENVGYFCSKKEENIYCFIPMKCKDENIYIRDIYRSESTGLVKYGRELVSTPTTIEVPEKIEEEMDYRCEFRSII